MTKENKAWDTTRVDLLLAARWGYPGFTGSVRGFDAAGLCVDACESGDWTVRTREGRLVDYGVASSHRAAMKAARSAAVAAVEGCLA